MITTTPRLRAGFTCPRITAKHGWLSSIIADQVAGREARANTAGFGGVHALRSFRPIGRNIRSDRTSPLVGGRPRFKRNSGVKPLHLCGGHAASTPCGRIGSVRFVVRSRRLVYEIAQQLQVTHGDDGNERHQGGADHDDAGAIPNDVLRSHGVHVPEARLNRALSGGAEKGREAAIRVDAVLGGDRVGLFDVG
jgi:hypothetical protein